MQYSHYYIIFAMFVKSLPRYYTTPTGVPMEDTRQIPLDAGVSDIFFIIIPRLKGFEKQSICDMMYINM